MNTQVNLEEFIHPRMDVLFVALNAPTKSNDNGHWFSGNLSFWNVLFNAGLITSRIYDPCKGDELVFGGQAINYQNWIYGLTDLVRDVVETDSSKVSTTSDQVRRILEIVSDHRTRKICLVHSSVAGQFDAEGVIQERSGPLDGYGLVGEFNSIPIYEVPFHNASIRDKHLFYELLKH